MTRPWPKSLPGQLMLLVAILLFVAQAINFAFLLNGRHQLRDAKFVVPAVNASVEAAEAYRTGTLPPMDRPWSRVHLFSRDPLPRTAYSPAPRVRNAAVQALSDAGIRVAAVAAGTRNVEPGDPRLRAMSHSRAERIRQVGGELRIALEIPGRGWLVLDSAWPGANNFLFWQLAAQTLVMYLVLLIPMFWIGRRIARPLHHLANAARGFDPASPAHPVAEAGPGDVRAVIAAFNQLSERVTAMLDEKDRMLGAIGHDLRTPLAALRVRIESVEDDTDRERMADIIEEMNRTLEDILSLARLGRPSEPVTETDLSALIEAVVDDFRDIGADVIAEPAPRLPIRLRSLLMRRAIRNLIENAVKYGGGARVSLADRGDTVSVLVADDGPGIPPDRMGEVFDPFTRLESSRNRDTGGIGLGLALARAIVREAGGEIVLANRESGGLDATIRLHRRRADPKAPSPVLTGR